MQKKIIALAVAGLVSGAAFAQSNVTVYGVVDVYGAHGKAGNSAGDQKANAINGGGLSGSRLGFKGTEALGNGLSTIFNFEFGPIDPTVGTNNGMASTRQAFVGLESKTMGKVVAGRLQGIGYNFGVKYDAMGVGIFSPVGQLTDKATVNSQAFSISSRDASARMENAVSYTSPTIAGGLKLTAEYGFTSEAAKTNTVADVASQYGVGAEYDNGPLSVGAGYVKHSDVGNTAANAAEKSAKEWAIGAGYDFKVVKLIASYQQLKYDTGASTTNATKGKIWNLGAKIPVGQKSAVNVAYAHFKDNGAATAEHKANSYGIDYEYYLSKRTTAYAGYARMANGANTALGLTGTTAAPSNDENVNLYAVGLRHTF